MITIIDYGMGNLRNVQRGLAAAGFESEITADPGVIRSARKVILPGVGAFGEAMKRIKELQLQDAIIDRAQAGVPFLGICLGMQLLFEESEESPGVSGLGLVSGKVLKFDDGLKVPHVGWNDVDVVSASPLFDAGRRDTYYFVHSFYVPVGKQTIGRSEYGTSFSAAIQKDSIFGVQFHPEKSQNAGLNLLRRFGEI